MALAVVARMLARCASRRSRVRTARAGSPLLREGTQGAPARISDKASGGASTASGAYRSSEAVSAAGSQTSLRGEADVQPRQASDQAAATAANRIAFALNVDAQEQQRSNTSRQGQAPTGLPDAQPIVESIEGSQPQPEARRSAAPGRTVRRARWRRRRDPGQSSVYHSPAIQRWLRSINDRRAGRSDGGTAQVSSGVRTEVGSARELSAAHMAAHGLLLGLAAAGMWIGFMGLALGGIGTVAGQGAAASRAVASTAVAGAIGAAVTWLIPRLRGRPIVLKQVLHGAHVASCSFAQHTARSHAT